MATIVNRKMVTSQRLKLVRDQYTVCDFPNWFQLIFCSTSWWLDFAIPFTVKTRPSASNNNNDSLASSESNQDSQSSSPPFVETVSSGPDSQSSSQPFIEPSPPQVESLSQVQSSSQVFVEPSFSPSLPQQKESYQSSTSTSSQLFVEVEPLLLPSFQPNKEPLSSSITSQVFVEPSTTQPTLRPSTKVTRSPSASPLATLSTYSPSDDPSRAPVTDEVSLYQLCDLICSTKSFVHIIVLTCISLSSLAYVTAHHTSTKWISLSQAYWIAKL